MGREPVQVETGEDLEVDLIDEDHGQGGAGAGRRRTPVVRFIVGNLFHVGLTLDARRPRIKRHRP
jgi:hypothetical protein